MIIPFLLLLALQQRVAIPVRELPECRAANRGAIALVRDATSDVTGDPVIGGGDRRVVVICSVDSFATERIHIWRVLIRDWQEQDR